MKYEKKHTTPFPVIEVSLEQNESICIEPGTMVYSDPHLTFQTMHNSTRQKRTGGKRIGFFSQGNKLISVVSAKQPARVAIAPCVPGDIIELSCNDSTNEQWHIISGAFLACDMDVNFELKQSSWTGMLSGGLMIPILETSGTGSCIVDSCGVLQKFNLNGQRIIDVDTNHLVAWSKDLKYETFFERNTVWNEFRARFSGVGSIIVQSNSRSIPMPK
ncbi:MAG: AIM24 family protein [Oscillospiraceae bacterium]|nr:AIM24 family protein [Oscillospiraceae bacterium]